MDKTMEDLVNELKRRTKLQQVPIPYMHEDYAQMVVQGIKEYYMDFCIGDEYEKCFDEANLTFLVPPYLTQKEYILIVSMINFYNVVKQDVNTIVGYSTDSLTITNADKPYANIANDLNLLDDRRTELFFKIKAERDL